VNDEKKRLGRPPITEGDPREKKSITLRRSTWAALEEKILLLFLDTHISV